MYQLYCKKCGSIELYTEEKGNQIGAYCADCGAWVKWLGKDELRAFNHSLNKKDEDEIIKVKVDLERGVNGLFLYINDYRITKSKPLGVTTTEKTWIVDKKDILKALTLSNDFPKGE